jgi:class 3 adenylate cyclase
MGVHVGPVSVVRQAAMLKAHYEGAAITTAARITGLAQDCQVTPFILLFSYFIFIIIINNY